MELIKTWSSSISCACVICVLIESILPRGNVSKSMQQILSAFILAIIFQPLSNLHRFSLQSFSSDLRKISSNLEFQNLKCIQKINRQIESAATDSIEKIIRKYLIDRHVRPVSINVSLVKPDKNPDTVTDIKCDIILQNADKSELEEIRKNVWEDLKIDAEVSTYENKKR